MNVLLADWIIEHLMGVEAIPGLGHLGLSKHAVGLILVAVAMLCTFIPFGRAVSQDLVPRGRLVNLLEVLLLYIRDEVARPFLGKDTDRFMPVLWTFFFFILYCNLLGLFPLLPVQVVGHDGEVAWSLSGVTPTGQVWVTGTLAFTAAIWWHGHGIKEQGFIPYLKNIVPSGLPLWLLPLMIPIELFSHVIKPTALMIRLWANMLGGHAVLYAIVGMIFLFGAASGVIVVPATVAILCLELFVAFLQAYVFTFLVTVFLGSAVHPDH